MSGLPFLLPFAAILALVAWHEFRAYRRDMRRRAQFETTLRETYGQPHENGSVPISELAARHALYPRRHP